MCYFLYGAINHGIHADDYKKVWENSKLRFAIGDKEEVNLCVEECGYQYRITDNHCDCDTSIGGENAEKEELLEYGEQILSMKKIRGIKYILLSKNWSGNKNIREIAVHIDDIEICKFLAEIEEDCLYRVDFYPRFL